jgi:probable HAF family extracellular repeat protein
VVEWAAWGESLFGEESMKSCSGNIGRLLVLVLLVAVATAAVAPVTFTFKTESFPGATDLEIFGVNNSQVGVGSYQDAQGVRHGFMASGQRLTKIDDPNGVTTYCFAINNLGAIVGYYVTSTFVGQAFLYQNGSFTDIGPTGSQALGINDNGDITGNFGDANGVHGFLLKGGTFTTIDVPGASFTLGGGINNAGIMTEVWLDSEGNAASSVYTGTKFILANVPGAESSSAGAISNSNDIVYSWEDSNDGYHGAVYHAGKFYNFDDPNGARTYGYGINDHLIIVGAYRLPGTLNNTGYGAAY